MITFIFYLNVTNSTDFYFFYLNVKRLKVTSNFVMNIKNLVVNHESQPKLNTALENDFGGEKIEKMKYNPLLPLSTN